MCITTLAKQLIAKIFKLGRTSAMEYPPVSTSRPGSRAGSSAGFRPISAPPKPGYTQAKSATLPTTPVSQVPPYRTTLHSPYGIGDVTDGRMSQASFASSMMATPDLNHSRTYTHGFPHFQHSTPGRIVNFKDPCKSLISMIYQIGVLNSWIFCKRNSLMKKI